MISHGQMVGNGNKPMTTQAVHFENFDVELSQPLKHRPDVIVIVTSDGRRSVIGDGQDLFTADEFWQINRDTKTVTFDHE